MTLLNFHKPLDGEVITLDAGAIVTIVETIDIHEDAPTGMPYDKWAEVRADDGHVYRIWDNGEVDLILDKDAYALGEETEERIGSCWALCDRYFAPLLAAVL